MATPECSKWIFFSCSTMGRDHTVHGFQFRSDVVAANDQNQVISAVVAVCHLRDVYTLTEQPSDSDFFRLPCLAGGNEVYEGAGVGDVLAAVWPRNAEG